MIVLDGDEKALMSDGVRAKRDIVQFVPFNEFKNQGLDSLAAGLFFFFSKFSFRGFTRSSNSISFLYEIKRNLSSTKNQS